MTLSSVSNSLKPQTAAASSTARALDGDYKGSGPGHRVKDADGDYKPSPTVAATSSTVSGSTQAAMSTLKRGG